MLKLKSGKGTTFKAIVVFFGGIFCFFSKLAFKLEFYSVYNKTFFLKNVESEYLCS
jgi:hypothetical protein